MNHLVASNKTLLRFQVDLAQTAVPVGSTSDTNGLVVANLHSAFPGFGKMRVTFAGIKAVTAIAAGASVTGLFVQLQKNGVNNVQIPASGDCSLTLTAGVAAAGTRDEEICNEVATKILGIYSGADAESYKLILNATGAATVPGTSTGLVEILVEVEVVGEKFPRI